jgi:DNA-binding XRE family transcriptional regulator
MPQTVTSRVFRNKVGAILKANRRFAGLTTRALGREIGVSHNFISDVETGQKLPSLIVALRLMKFFNLAAKVFIDCMTL